MRRIQVKIVTIRPVNFKILNLENKLVIKEQIKKRSNISNNKNIKNQSFLKMNLK